MGKMTISNWINFGFWIAVVISVLVFGLTKLSDNNVPMGQQLVFMSVITFIGFVLPRTMKLTK